MGKPRSVLVTGANRGLGRAVAARMHHLGHRVVIAGRDGVAAKETAATLGAPASSVQLEVTDPGSVTTAREAVGPVDALVCNAGVMLDAGHLPSTIDLGLVREHLEVNTLGAWRVCQEFLPGMIRRGWGRIVMVTSGIGIFSNGLEPRAPAYSMSKVALNALTVLLSKETEGTGVLINAVNPGMVRTRMLPHAEQSPDEAAVEVVKIATLPDGAPTGALFRNGRVIDW
jgi:NAD(P)-dependent dehydrogenase (short-subunit alcohol dehydrogenase family)